MKVTGDLFENLRRSNRQRYFEHLHRLEIEFRQVNHLSRVCSVFADKKKTYGQEGRMLDTYWDYTFRDCFLGSIYQFAQDPVYSLSSGNMYVAEKSKQRYNQGITDFQIYEQFWQEVCESLEYEEWNWLKARLFIKQSPSRNEPFTQTKQNKLSTGTRAKLTDLYHNNSF